MEGVLAFWGFLVGFGWVTWVIAGTVRRTRAARLQAEVHNKLLDRFGSSRELLEYLQTTPGARLLEVAVPERTNPYGRILTSVQSGVILTLLGSALLFLQRAASDQEVADVLLVFGTLILALGVGFLVSAAASFVLSRSWGLLDRDSRPAEVSSRM